jgi:hypothetical protein
MKTLLIVLSILIGMVGVSADKPFYVEGSKQLYILKYTNDYQKRIEYAVYYAFPLNKTGVYLLETSTNLVNWEYYNDYVYGNIKKIPPNITTNTYQGLGMYADGMVMGVAWFVATTNEPMMFCRMTTLFECDGYH